jgi:hypothetical protein
MEEKITLVDRLWIALLNVVVSLLTGFLLWLALNGFLWGVVGWLPAVSILWFTGTMAILGALMQEVLFMNIYTKCWHFLVRWFGRR